MPPTHAPAHVESEMADAEELLEAALAPGSGAGSPASKTRSYRQRPPDAFRTTSAAEVRTGRSGRQSTDIVRVDPESVRCRSLCRL